MNFSDNIQNKTLKRIAEKVLIDTPVSEEDALYMPATDDILDLGAIADHVRTRLHGDITYYGVNMRQEASRPLCPFSFTKKTPRSRQKAQQQATMISEFTQQAGSSFTTSPT